MNRFTLEVDEDGMLILNDEILAATGWEEGDELEWVDRGDGSWTLTKVDESKENMYNK